MRYLLLTAFFAISILNFGCTRVTEVVGGSSSSGSAKPTGEFAPTDNPTSDMEKLAERFSGLRSFKAKMVTDTQPPIHMDLEYAAPDRFRMQGSNTQEMMLIGRTTYLKIGDTWRMFSMPVDPNLVNIRKAFDKDNIKWLSNVRYVGEETVDGKPTYLYTYQNQGPNSQGENDSKVWVSTDRGLPLKIESVYKSGSMKSMTITYDYTSEVSIEAPAKAVPAKPGQN